MAEAASMSVSQAKIFFVQGANTEMKMNVAIAENSVTWPKIFTARQWAAQIGFCGVEKWKQVLKNVSISKRLVMQ